MCRAVAVTLSCSPWTVRRGFLGRMGTECLAYHRDPTAMNTYRKTHRSGSHLWSGEQKRERNLFMWCVGGITHFWSGATGMCGARGLTIIMQDREKEHAIWVSAGITFSLVLRVWKMYASQPISRLARGLMFMSIQSSHLVVRKRVKLATICMIFFQSSSLI